MTTSAAPRRPATAVTGRRLTGERALFRTVDATVTDSVFADGESPLKESARVDVDHSVFDWKYPLWYTTDVSVRDSALTTTARSGLWYADGVRVTDSTIDAPKTFRRSRRVVLERVALPDAQETLWTCEDVVLDDVSARGDYFGLNSSRVRARRLTLSGNYAFDGASDVTVDGARILSKDAFWNCRGVTVRDALIVGEYLGWNSSDLTFENCTITSLQGLCYVDGLTMRNCRLIDTTRAFEYSTVDVEVTTTIDSVVNPRGGVIRARGIGELVIDPDEVDPDATRILLSEPSCAA